jgi:SprT-like family protein
MLLNTVFALRSTLVFCLSLWSYSPVPEEPYRDSDLQSVFQSINELYFNRQLKDVNVSWANLTYQKAQALTLSYDNGSFKIEVDRATNFNPGHTLSVLKHEACHVQTMTLVVHADIHGSLFRACMRRYR